MWVRFMAKAAENVIIENPGKEATNPSDATVCVVKPKTKPKNAKKTTKTAKESPKAKKNSRGNGVDRSAASSANQNSGEVDAFSRKFWQELCPELHVVDVDWLQSQSLIGVNDGSKKGIASFLDREGYVHLEQLQWQLPIDVLADSVQRIQARGLVPPFCFIYDEFWMLFAKLDPLLQGQLGKDYQQLPDFWAWIVDPRRGESGWKPHRDKGYKALFPDGRPRALTAWVALSDSTTHNGCMYIVPADRDPTYGKVNDQDHKFDLSDIRALPAKAGDTLVWNQAVLHWGSRSAPRNVPPRVSVAFEFQCAESHKLNDFVMVPKQIPSFEARISLICKQILQYQHMYPLQQSLKTFAEQVVAQGQLR